MYYVNELYLYLKQILYLNYFFVICSLNIFVNFCLSNILSIHDNYKNILADELILAIQYNGSTMIKLFQWINVLLSNLTALDISKSNILYNKLYKHRLEKLYENCKIHELDYTRNIFNSEYKMDLDEVIELDNNYSIKSGSIAQVYKGRFKHNKKDIAIKVVHPNIKYQIVIFNLFINAFGIHIMLFFIEYIYGVKNVKKIFSLKNFINNMKNQTNMIYEDYFLKYYYNEYKDDEYIIIPKSYFSSKNLLIMDYEEGENIENLEISDYTRQKLYIFNSLFYRDILYHKQYVHADLHNGNIKLQKFGDFYRLVVYDFGFCLKHDKQEFIKNMDIYVSLYNYNLLGKLTYNNLIKNAVISEKTFVDDFSNHFNDYLNNNNKNISNLVDILFDYLLKNNYDIDLNFIDLIISSNIGYKYSLYNDQNNNIDIIYCDISFLDEYKILPELKEFYKKLLDDDIYKKNSHNFILTDVNNNNSSNNIISL